MDTIDVAALAGLTDIVLIDVREVHEFAAGHAPMAINVPMSELADRLGDVPEGRPAYVICESGVRSDRVALWLSGQGIEAVNVLGGTSAWRAAGFEISTETH